MSTCGATSASTYAAANLTPGNGGVYRLGGGGNNLTLQTIVGTVGVGGYGFLVMFYLAGVAGVPRRYAVYPPEVAVGTMYAKISLIFIAVLLIGALVYIWETGRRCLKAFSS